MVCRWPPRLSRCRLVIPDEAGIGATPHSLAQAASERTRSMLSPATMSSSAAMSVPMPKAAHELRYELGGQVLEDALVLGDLFVEVQPAPRDGAQGVYCGGLDEVHGAGNQRGAAA